MTQIELLNKIKQEIERRSYGEQGFNSEDAEYGYRSCARDLLSFLDTLEGGSSEIPTLPFAEKEGIPGKDFIPVEWVDACERYGKWIIVKVALISELLFQLLTTGMGGWGKRPEQEPEVDLEEEADKMFFSLGWYEGDHHQPMLDCVSLEQFRGIARHFYELKNDLSIHDLELLHTFLYAVKNNKQGAFTFTSLSDEQYQEVLRRFKNAK